MGKVRERSGVVPEGHKEPERRVGEPPASFPFDRTVFADVAAWAAACPNVYYGENLELCCSRIRYLSGVDPDKGIVPFNAVNGREQTVSDPDPEDLPEVLESYLRCRKRFQNFKANYRMPPGEKGPTTVDVEVEGKSAFQSRVVSGSSGLSGHPWPRFRDRQAEARRQIEARQDETREFQDDS